MAILWVDIRSYSRGRGRSAVAGAAYISRSKLRDERLGKNFDFQKRGGLEHTEIFVPEAAEGRATILVPERSELWNRAEQAERRRDARVALEYRFALPHELAPPDRIALARRFAQEIATRNGSAVDLAVNLPRPEGDPRNFHAHALSTTREIHRDGFGRKTDMERRDAERREMGLLPMRDEYRRIRARVAELTNEALQERGLSVRVDPRTLAEQGIDRVPQRHVSPAVIAIMRRGGHSYVMEGILAAQAAEQEVALERERARVRDAHLNPLERQRQRAIESWQAYRRAAHDIPGATEREAPDRERAADRSASDDYDR